MSAPTKLLGNLSLGSDMSSTRAGSQNQRQKPPYATEDSSDSESEEEPLSSEGEEEEEEEEEEECSPSSPVTFSGTSSIVYDLQMLSHSARAKARHGLSGEFSVDKCRPIYGGGYDFHVVDYGRVYVGEGPMVCSCLDFQGSHIACRHIYVSLPCLYSSSYPAYSRS